MERFVPFTSLALTRRIRRYPDQKERQAMAKRKLKFTLCSVLAVVAFAACARSWIVWPRQTAVTFLMEREAANKAAGVSNPFRDGTLEFFDFETNQKPLLSKQLLERKLDVTGLTPHDRNLMDILLARQTFDFQTESFTVCRGKVVWGPKSFWAWLGGRSYR